MTTRTRRRVITPAARVPGPAEVRARYDAAGAGRRIATWRPPQSGPNVALENLERLRARARDAARNEWAGEAPLTRWQSTLIGVGIQPRFKRIPEGARRREITDLWADWVKVADADGVLNFYGLQALAVREWLDSGEVFIRLRPRTSGPYPVPLQVQLIESDFVPRLDTDSWPGMNAGNTIRSGIERNAWGRRVAYWMYPDHPGEINLRTPPSLSNLVRVPAAQVRHLYEPKRAGQLRGVSMLAPVLTRLRNAGDFEDAVLDRQKLANLFVAFLTKAIPDAAWNALDLDATTGLPNFYDASGRPMQPMEPGTTQELMPGEGVTFANPPEAGISHSDYMRTVHMGTAAGSNLPYELLSGDIRNVSDRTLRVVILEFRRFARQRQWHIVIPMMCQPVLEAWASAAALDGSLRVREVDAVMRAEWSPEGWEYIHPVQDPQGRAIELAAGLTSRGRVIGEKGDDRADIDQERADDDVSEQALGLTHTFSATPSKGDSGGAAPAADPAAAATNAALLDAIRLVSQQGTPEMVAALARIEARAAAPAPVAQAPVMAAPSFTAHVHLPMGMVNVEPAKVEVSVEAPAVSVEAAAPVVVPAPVVHVVNDVQPADVKVELPDRETTSVIERDDKGGIVAVTQTERTIQ